jgi:ubiquinone/menaquinone biosynthesis C-methylase UbiE
VLTSHSVANLAERATSFGAIAEDYDRLRPSSPDEVIAWLLPPDGGVVLDLAAGTGLLSRGLARQPTVRRVIAIELDGRMAAVLRARSPAVTVLQGRGEAIPLAGGGMDAVLISSAWHWLDRDRAVPELSRVLRSGGRLGVLWTGMDRDAGWLPELDRYSLRRPSSGDASHSGRHRVVELPEADAASFGGIATRTFQFTRTMPVDDFVAMLATYSGLITAGEQERAATLARTRAELARLFPGASQLDIPMRTRCWRADRR